MVKHNFKEGDIVTSINPYYEPYVNYNYWIIHYFIDNGRRCYMTNVLDDDDWMYEECIYLKKVNKKEMLECQ